MSGETMTKERQERLTHKDSIGHHKKLLSYILEKIENEPHYHRTRDEMLEFMEMVANSFLASGVAPRLKVVPKYPTEDGSVCLGVDIHHFALNIMMNLRSDVTLLKTRGKTYRISSVELWKTFYKYVLLVIPLAEAEALHESAERESRMAIEGYQFGVSEENEH
jgi:hypothetical protein